MDNDQLQQQLESAQADGVSMQTVGILVNNLTPVTMAGAQGIAVNNLAGDEVTLYARVIDYSGSMLRFKGAVQEAANDQLRALAKSEAGDSILMSTWLFHTQSSLLHSYVELNKATHLDDTNYLPDRMSRTALYDATLDSITSVVGYAQSLRNAGIRVKVVLVVITDGEDNASRQTAAAVKSVITDLINQEIYTFALVAFGVHGKRIAAEMGIPAENVLDTTADDHSVRLALGTVSESVIGVSQSVVGSGGAFFS